ncbi:hypothetical protein [Allonocardiopsis opalescens]|uniref:Phage integrase family protein n=1 Tax=Allonocardiopsis opalescens TaxID=1144618 RepID=A0A2T0QF38_9ACTN|nr:hypothetical protein [Allonocardiopsis opalescens]PRY02528.1 hypothetical protein CLV72_1011130 [Allonocardiopsis opalescens]
MAIDNEWDAVFTAPMGGLRDPSTPAATCAGRWMRPPPGPVRSRPQDRDHPHGRGRSERADRLGHAKASMRQDVYFSRKKAATGAATVLQAVVGE